MTAPRVECLLMTGSPTAVAWFVVAVIVDTLNRVLRAGLAAHVCQEMLKRIGPSGAHGNPTATVVRVTDVLRVKAPTPKPAPCIPLWRSSLAMCQELLPALFSPEAAATRTAAGDEVALLNARGGAAIAPAQPYESLAVSFSRESGQSAEAVLSNGVFRDRVPPSHIANVLCVVVREALGVTGVPALLARPFYAGWTY